MEPAIQGEQSGVVTELPLRKGPGERLRAARVAAGIPLERVANDLHLHPELLEALERDIYGQMPGRVFARGYLRNYARLVELDPDQILAAYDALFPAPDEADGGLHRVVSGQPLRSSVDSGHGFVRIVTWGIVLGLIVLLLIWWQGYLTLPGLTSTSPQPAPDVTLPAGAETSSPAMQRDVAAQLAETPPARSEAGAAPAPVPEAARPATVAAEPARPAPAAESPAGPAPKVVLQVTARTWAEVVDASGQFKLNGTFERGYTKTLGGEPPYRISIGNVNGARITVDGEPLDLKPHFNGRLVRLTLDPRRATKPE
jgi:cytoskeleton protein RodZ